jgi:hypothetical protein
VSWSRRTGANAKVADDQELLHKTTNPRDKLFQPGEYPKYLFDAVKNRLYHFSMKLWLSGLIALETREDAYAAGLPDASGVRCPHFDPASFLADKKERRLGASIFARSAFIAMVASHCVRANGPAVMMSYSKLAKAEGAAWDYRRGGRGQRGER